MSPSSRELAGPRPAPLKIHRDSHCIHKPNSSCSSSTATTTTSSSSSSSSSTITTNHNNNGNGNGQNHQHCQPPSQQQQQQQQQQRQQQQQQQHHPVIIYTHSPKVIHTDARDFMALVQKLTGLDNSSSASASAGSSHQHPQPPSNGAKDGEGANAPLPADESPTSSETCIAVGGPASTNVHVGMNSAAPPPPSLVFEPFATEIPIFGPAGCGGGSAEEFFCRAPARGFYRYPADPAVFAAAPPPMPNLGGGGGGGGGTGSPFSPSVMEAMRAFTDY